VSADADPTTGYVAYWRGGWTTVGGTSASAPLWAGLAALADESCGASPLGLLNPQLYAIASGAGAASALNDITSGDNDIASPSGPYPATAGYDMASGLGTPIAGGADGLVAQLCARTGPRPMVSSVTPTSGPATGEPVTIDGSGFVDGATVGFGATAASAVKVVSYTQLTATAPAGSGSVDVTVTTPLGTSATSAADVFTYPPPAPAVVAPSPVAPPAAPVAAVPSASGTLASKQLVLKLTLRQSAETILLGNLVCPSGCRAAIRASATIAVAATKAHRRHSSNVQIGSLAISLHSGAQRQLKLALNAQGRRLLTRLGKLSVTIRVDVAQPAVAGRTVTRRLTLHAPAAKRRQK
jgi:hypothetical protein